MPDVAVHGASHAEGGVRTLGRCPGRTATLAQYASIESSGRNRMPQNVMQSEEVEERLMISAMECGAMDGAKNSRDAPDPGTPVFSQVRAG